MTTSDQTMPLLTGQGCPEGDMDTSEGKCVPGTFLPGTPVYALFKKLLLDPACCIIFAQYPTSLFRKGGQIWNKNSIGYFLDDLWQEWDGVNASSLTFRGF